MAKEVSKKFLVANGVAVDEKLGPYLTYVELSNNDVKDLLSVWCKGGTSSSKKHKEFFMFSPVDLCVKGKPMQYHIYVHDFARDAKNHEIAETPFKSFLGGIPGSKDNDEIYEAIVHATRLMSRSGKAWTKAAWDQNKDNGSDAYPWLSLYGFRNPVFCAFQLDGYMYGFTLVEDAGADDYKTRNNEYKGEGKPDKMRRNMRGQFVRMGSGNLAQDFRNCQTAGLEGIRFKKDGAAEYHKIEEVTVANLKKLVETAGGTP